MSFVDERIVRMHFDNAQFEAASRVTMQTLEKLKSALKLDKAGQAFESVTKAANEVDLAALQNGVDVVAGRFSNLGIIGMTALQNITNAAVNAGTQMIKSLTIDPINQGFGEYELKMGSVQTIIASTGADLDTVNGYLEQLNTYADKTIYSFSDMTNSIGKFTNAGVDLDTAVKAIQGISNEAALSGANAQEASRAMYNFSQALSAGSVKLIDWKSIENANMATKEFKNELIKTAVKVGTLTKAEGGYISTTTDANGHVSELFNSTKNFNNSLSAQWMTTEVLTKTLSRYANENTKLGKRAFAAAQDVKTFSQMMDTLKEAVGSGWSQTFEWIFGDFEQAKRLWTGVANAIGGVIDQTSDARNAVLRTWTEFGGRDAMIRGFANVWKGLLSVLSPIKQAFDAIFGSIKGYQLANLSRGFANFTKKLILTDKTSKNLQDTFKVLFSIIKIPVAILKTLAKLIAPILTVLMRVGGVILSITGFISRLILGVSEGISKFIDFVDIGGRIQKVGDAISKSFGAVKKAVSGAIDSFKNLAAVKAISSAFQRAGNNIKTTFKVISGSVKSAVDSAFSKFTENASGYLTAGIESLTGWVGSLIDKAKGIKSVSKLVESFTGLIGKLTGKTEKLKHSVEASRGEVIVARFKSMRDSIVDIFNKIKAIPAVQAATGLIGKVLGDIANFALDKISGFLDKLAAFDFDTFIADVNTFFTDLYNSEEVQTFLAALVEVFNDLSVKADEAKVALKGAWDSFKTDAAARVQKVIDFLGEFALACKDVHSASDLLGVVKQYWDKLVESFKNLKPVKAFTKAIKELKDSVGGKAKTAKDGISKFFKTFTDSLKKVNFLKLARGIRDTALAIRLIVGAFNAFRLNNQIVGVLKQVKKSLRGYQRDLNANALLKVAGAIAILVGAIIAIAYSADKIRAAKDVLFAVAVGILFFVAMLGVIKKALEKEDDGPDSVNEALANVLTKLQKTLKGFLKAATFTMAAAGIYLLTKSLKTIIEALKAIGDFDASKLLDNVEAIGSVVAAMIGLAVISRLAGPNAASFGIGVLALAAGIKLLIQDVIDIANLNMSEAQMKKVAGVLTGVGLVLVVLTGLSSLITNGADVKGMLGFAGMFIGLGYGIKLIVQSMELIAKLDESAIKKSILVFVVLGILIVSMMRVSKNAKGVKTGPIVALALAVGVIAGSLWLLSGIEWTKLLTATAAMGLVLLALGFVASQLKGLKPGPAIVGAIALGLMLAAVVGAFVALDYFKVDGILEKAEGISLVLGTCAIVIALLGQLPISAGITAATNLATFLGVLAGALTLIGGFANYASAHGSKEMGDIDKGIEIVKKVGEAIGGFIGGIAAGAIEEVTSVGDSMKKFAESMDYVMFVFEKHDGQAVATTAKGLSDALTSLIGANFINNIASVFGGENGQLDDFGEKLKSFGEALVTYSNTVSELKTDAIDKSVAAAEQLTALSDQVHNGGIIGKWTGNQDLDTFGKNLKKFGNALTTFSSKTSELDTSKFEEIASATEPLIALTDKIHNGGIIGKWTGNSDLDTFGKNLKKFGKGLKSYGESIAEVDAGQIKTSADMISPFVDLTDRIHNSGVIDKWIGGDQDLDTFGKNLEKFGKSLVKYSESINGDAPLDVEQIATSAKAASALADVAVAVQDIPKGSTTLGNFSGSLASFGSQLKNYGDNISGLSGTIVTDSQLAHNAMVHIVAAAVACKDASDGGWFSETSLGEFSSQLEPFGAAIKAYGDAITGLDTDIIQNTNKASTTLRILAHASEEIPNSGGFIGAMVGNNDLGKFGTNMETFGGAIAGYGNAISNLHENVVANTKRAAIVLKELSKAAEEIPNSGGVIGVIVGNNDINDFGADLSSFAGSLADFSGTLADVKFDNINKTVTAVNDLATMAKTAEGVNAAALGEFTNALVALANNSLTGFTDAFAVGAAKIKVQIKSFITAIGNIVKQADLSPAGKHLIDSVIKGVRDNVNNITQVVPELIRTFNQGVINSAGAASSAGAALTNSAASGARSANSGDNSFYQIGRNFGEGLRLGIKSREHDVEQAGYDLGAAAVKGAKKAPQVKSPSRVAIRIGGYIGEGLIIGMDSYASRVERAGYALGSTAATSIDQMVAAIMDAAETDAQPVITPVLDLSQIQNGSSMIGGMLNAQAVSFNAANASIASLSASVGSMNDANTNNERIVTAISELRSDVVTLGNRMRNLQVVMDSGELVGSITDRVDRSLGIKYA